MNSKLSEKRRKLNEENICKMGVYNFQSRVEGVILCINFTDGFSGVILPNEILTMIFEFLWIDERYERQRDNKQLLLKQKLKHEKRERQKQRDATKIRGKKIIRLVGGMLDEDEN